MQRPTMEDVAARAGVSRALVSLVMRESPKVSPHRREAVLRAAEELGYSPHAMARSLASRTSTVLGVMVSDLHNPFFAEIVDGLDAAARAEGFELIINTGGRSASREGRAVESLLSFRPAGLVLLGPAVPAAAIASAADRAPVVLVARSSRLRTVDTVNDDGEAGSQLAVDHLVGLGHTRIAHLDGGHGSQAAPRKRGYTRAMRRHGLEPVVLPSEYTDVAGAKTAGRLLERVDELPTAIVAANDFNAVGAISALEESGLEVPRDISVIGYDNTSLAALSHVALTTVDQPRREMGRLAAEALLQRVREGRTEPVRHLLQPKLVARSTTTAPPEPHR
ncbi:LacI family transcriptional regulator [Saccharopolyspora erythraea NRRL 2338]|uniref:Transcriptional regulator, LacI family n=2 Tax=Saccharopolyspora erythraea TaxID=1836 RepID=A4FES5_SACEN|nr:LacI family DNA-binding transcriptional regulator [Saccharopolyspora erythraea]EQD82211.1 LacI family transcriptional regulator [Saccharopolyspora erythraea D]PFG96275.1 LacI family transcriptional regulator [Saccharopolyspora erythraea NRRL 2338]QRK92795.1 LacI family DNA-binding transcriptional regulator [Saccharopolyspora erythraea]CAM02550.1 transcriptional regulator, LacI family [Saccharopolyspora erythraea NRRL 2338]